MKKPVHPGRVIRNACLEPLGLSVTESARILGVTRQALSNVINGKAGISPEMAIRLTKAFGVRPKRDCACNWPTTLRKPAKTKTGSRFGVSTQKKLESETGLDAVSSGSSP